MLGTKPGSSGTVVITLKFPSHLFNLKDIVFAQGVAMENRITCQSSGVSFVSDILLNSFYNENFFLPLDKQFSGSGNFKSLGTSHSVVGML